MVGADGSVSACAAGRWAAEEARLRDVPLHVVRTWAMPIIPWTASPPPIMVDPEVYGAAARHTVERVRDDLRRDLGERAPAIETSIVQGSSVPSLLEASAGSDFLVLGSRGHGGFAGLLLGSVAIGCTHRATVLVAVVREPGTRAGRGAMVVGAIWPGPPVR